MNDFTDNQATVILIGLGFLSIVLNVWIDEVHTISFYLFLTATIVSFVVALSLCSKDDKKEKQNDE